MLLLVIQHGPGFSQKAGWPKSSLRSSRARHGMAPTFQRHIDRQSGKKLYLQLAEIIKQEVDTGRMEIGSQLPSEDALCEEFNISKAVVRQALAELVREGYLRKVQGKGTYIDQPIHDDGLPMLRGLREFSIDFSASYTVRVIEKKVTIPPEEVRQLFKDEEIRTTKIVRLITLRRDPVILDTLYVPEAVCPGLGLLDLRAQSFYDILEKRYHRAVRKVAESFDHTLANEHEAQILACDTAAPLLLVDRILYAEGEAPIGFGRSLCHTERGRITIICHRR